MASGPNPSAPLRIVAFRLRKYRAAAGLTQGQAAAQARLTGSALSNYEQGFAAMRVVDAERLLGVYGVTGEELSQLLTLVEQSRRRGKLRGIRGVVWPPLEELIALERDASRIEEFALSVLPGVLQTESYSRAVLSAGALGDQVDQVDQHVQARMDRAAALFDGQTRPSPPTMTVVIRESVLHVAVGGAAVMRDQLDHLLELAAGGHVTLHILPNSRGAHSSMSSWFSLLSFDDLDPDYALAYTDYLTGSVITDDADEVARFRAAFTRLRELALAPAASRKLIHAAKDEYR